MDAYLIDIRKHKKHYVSTISQRKNSSLECTMQERQQRIPAKMLWYISALQNSFDMH